MEVREERVDNFKLKAGKDKDVVFALGLFSFSVKLERAGDGCSDGDDLMIIFFRGFNSFESFAGERKPFGVHLMIFDFIGANWEESPETDVEG